MNYHRILLQSGADKDAKDSALHNASFYGHLEIVDLLLEAGADQE